MKKILSLMVLATLIFSAQAFAADPVVGKWKLDVAKSRFAPDSALTAGSRIYSESKGMYVLKQSVTTTDGKRSSSTAKYRDGVEVKQPAGSGADSVMAKKLDANTWDFELKKDGKVVGHVHRTVSADGNTLTVQQSGVRLGGATGEETLVFDKE